MFKISKVQIFNYSKLVKLEISNIVEFKIECKFRFSNQLIFIKQDIIITLIINNILIINILFFKLDFTKNKDCRITFKLIRIKLIRYIDT